MNRIRLITTFILAAGLGGGAALVRADDTAPSGAAARTNASATVQTDAAAQARLESTKQRMLDRSAKVSAASRTKAEQEMDASAKEIDAHATGDEETKVAERLGKEFGMTTDAVLAEKTSLGASWGDLTIAHALAANTKTGATVSDLVALKQGGMGWGTIAAGMGLKLGPAVSGVKAESQVARGLAKADGHATAAVRGAGAHADAGGKLGANAGVGKGVSAGAGVDAGVKVGGKIKP